MEKLTYSVKTFDFGYYLSYEGRVSLTIGGRVLWTQATKIKRPNRIDAIEDAIRLQHELAERNMIDIATL
jgi:hypothetical protein